MADERPIDRRDFWRAALRGLTPSRMRKPKPARRMQPPPPAEPVAPPTVLRPPGAAAEPSFVSLCASGCRSCVDACPRFVIIPSLDSGQPGGGDGRPYMLPDRAACDMCGLCMLACPTGALSVVAPADVRIGLAVVDVPACVRTHGQPCSICIERCPYPDAAIRDEGGFPTIDAAHCTGCGLCAEACPPHAIDVVARE